jgi:hypothetical protein
MTTQDAYARKAEARLEELDAEIARIKAKAKGAKADAEIEYTEHLAELREKRDFAERTLTEFRAAGEDAADDIKEGIERAWNDLKSAVDRARQRFG